MEPLNPDTLGTEESVLMELVENYTNMAFGTVQSVYSKYLKRFHCFVKAGIGLFDITGFSCSNSVRVA